MGAKIYLDVDVYTAARARIRTVYEAFGRNVSVAFSGGKDSTVLLHLAIEVATEMGLLPVRAMFIDLEGQYEATIAHVTEMFDDPRVAGTWICAHLNLRNAVSFSQPHWGCWDPSARERWVRPMPTHPTVVSDTSGWPFWFERMEFEEFVPAYEDWLAEQAGERLAVLVGIRSDESLNRFRTFKRDNIGRWNGHKWTTEKSDHVVNCYPIYDWGTEDIWTYVGRSGCRYNRLYDYMWLQGTGIHDQRICQPYGDDQRVSLDMFHEIEPETWERVLNRVEGVNSGALYARSGFLGYRGGMGLPDGLKGHPRGWKVYTKLLLAGLPPDVAAQYREKFLVFMKWWRKNLKRCGHRRFLDEGITGATGKRLPSWQRMALCILKNDYWCHSLTFSQTTRVHEKQKALRAKYADI